MKNRKSIFILFLIFTMLLPLAEGFIPSAEAAPIFQPINFSSTIPVGYEAAGYVVAMDNFELWHHSGGYWSNEALGIRIEDSEIIKLANNEITHDHLKNRTMEVTRSLPSEVTAYLQQGGTLDNVFLKFSAGYGLIADELYDEPQYSLTNNSITIRTKLRFHINPVPFAQVDGVSFWVWQPKDGHGKTTFSIFTRTGQHLGAAYTDDVPHPVSKGDILNAQGHLRGGKQYSIVTGNGTITRDGSEIQVGYGTFASGGAVGMHFKFPLRVEFYIPSNLDTVKVHYVDENGQELLPAEQFFPEKEGQYTVTAKTIEGYDLISPSSQTVTIGKNGKEHQVTFRYKAGELKADFDVVPDSIRYGDSFILRPKDIKIPTGRTVARIDYRIYSPDRSQSRTVSTFAANDRKVAINEYPPFFSSNVNQTYPIEMVLTDSAGNKAPVVTKTLTIKANNLSADFDILPGQNLTFRDSFSLVPKNINTDNLTYDYHRFRIQRNGNTYISPRIYGINEGITFTYATYPYVIGIGTHTVEIEVVTKEGQTTGWVAAKTLTMTSPTVNSPPVFHVAWVRPNDPTQTPVTQALLGEVLNLIVLDNPPPYDPEGDEIYWLGFDFTDSSSWAKTIPSKYQEYVNGYHNIIMDQVGFHMAKGTMRDQWGATATRSASVTVVPPNPVPVITGPTSVVEGRPIEPMFSSEKSYSPAGRKIDHSRDEWENKKDVYTTPGNEIIRLHVYDEEGLKSLSPAEHLLVVLPDLPPMPVLEYTDKVLRNTDVTFVEKSYSPDHDKIVEKIITWRYDSDNDGNFDEEPAHSVTLSSNRTFTIRPTKVGKYRITVFLKEDWGKTAEEHFFLDCVNDSPTVFLSLSSYVQEPFAPTFTNLPMNTFKQSGWNAYGMSGTIGNGWTLSGSAWDRETILVSPNFTVSPYRFSGAGLTKKIEEQVVSYDGWRKWPLHYEYLYKDRDGFHYLINEMSYESYCGYQKCTYKRTFIASDNGHQYGSENTYNASSYKIQNLETSIDRVNQKVLATNGDKWVIYTFDDFVKSGQYPIGTYPNDVYEGPFDTYPYTPPVGPYEHPVNRVQIPEYESNPSSYVLKTNDGYQIYVTNPGYVQDMKLNIKSPSGQITQFDLSALYGSGGGCYKRHFPNQLQLVGDGLLLVWSQEEESCSSVTYNRGSSLLLSSAYNDNAIPQTYSLLYNPGSVKLNDFELRYNLKFDTIYPGLYAGFAFRIQDYRNMYRVEADGKHVRLVKIVNGTRTVLQQANLTVNPGFSFPFSVKAIGNTIRVYANKVPVIEVVDSTFSSGNIGPYSEVEKVQFLSASYADLGALHGSTSVKNTVLVDGEIIYTVTISDTENDPLIPSGDKWIYRQIHTKFLDAGDGKSGEFGQTLNTRLKSIGKVGDYQVTYEAKDDPHPEYRYPSMVFDSYRKSSNPYTTNLIVHRAPISLFSVTVNADGSLKWTDASYDPDRWLSPTHYSTEPTGINYATTRGILEYKYYYVSPSGQIGYEKLIFPTEIGEYTVAQAVRDEYGAWSGWTERTVNVTKIPTPDAPPIAGFNVNPTTTYRGVTVTITSTARDPEDGSSANLDHVYYMRNTTKGTPESIASTSRTTWTTKFSELGTYEIRQVVTDSKGQSAQMIRNVNVVNRAPAVTVTYPNGTASAPTLVTEPRPVITWSYSDADGDPQQKYRVFVKNTSGVVAVQSGDMTGSNTSWQVTSHLADNTVYTVEVEVFDGYDWTMSEKKYLRTKFNRPPVADFDWTPKPVYEGDTITLIDRSSDPDGDPLSYEWTVSGPNGYSRSSTSKTFAILGTDTENRTGTYNVMLTVRDPRGESDTVTKTITVSPLGINGYVEHTERWNENRIRYNRKHSGTDDSPRPYEYFWAGERFILKADTTETATSTKADTVTVRMRPTGGRLYSTTLDPTNTNRTTWYGELYQKGDFDRLKDGPVEFEFEVLYTNGVVKRDVVTVVIDGNWTDYFQLHRVR